MKERKNLIYGLIACCVMMVMILDTRTAFQSAQEGIGICIRTVIPSLFPFLALSSLISSCLLGQRIGFLQPIARFCKIPNGAESLLVLGFLTGYPIGAQLITQAYRDKKLSAVTARRMLGFCNNAGPAFLFGMLSPLFANAKTVWILWAVHILSALLVSCILPASKVTATTISPCDGKSFPESLQNALKAIAGICGWVVLFRILLGFCNRWFLWLFPAAIQVFISGLLELANGCVLLQNIPQEGTRFLLSATMLSFGGLCVGMQTVSVTSELGTGWYFPGKVLQTVITVLISTLLQPILFTDSEAASLPLPCLLALVFILLTFIYALYRKKVVAFSGGLMYNTRK